MILGLDRPTAGEALVNGRPFADHDAPCSRSVPCWTPKPSIRAAAPRNHLRSLALANGIGGAGSKRSWTSSAWPRWRPSGRRVLAGHGPTPRDRLRPARRSRHLDPRRAGQRPRPEGILWIRNLLRSLAAEGRTVLVSSHLMSEMALTAEHLIIVGQGPCWPTTASKRRAASGHNSVRVRTPQADELAACSPPRD